MLNLLIALSFGVLFWTFAEYATHHWVNHLGRGKNPLSKAHLEHHRTSELVKPWVKYLNALVLTLVFGSIAVLISGMGAGAAWTLGFVSFYLVYEWTHERLHSKKPTTKYGALLRRHHFSHHFSSAKYNHGVTTRIWDRVFGSYAPLKMIRVPKRHLMPWLVDGEGRVLPEYAAHYQIR